MRGALTATKVKHLPALIEPRAVGELMRALGEYRGAAVTKAALLISAYIPARPGEIRWMPWEEIDREEGAWRVPGAVMKSGRDHIYF